MKNLVVHVFSLVLFSANLSLAGGLPSGIAQTEISGEDGRFLYVDGEAAQDLYESFTNADEQTFGPEYLGYNSELTWRTGTSVKCTKEVRLYLINETVYSCYLRILNNGTVDDSLPNEF